MKSYLSVPRFDFNSLANARIPRIALFPERACRMEFSTWEKIIQVFLGSRVPRCVSIPALSRALVVTLARCTAALMRLLCDTHIYLSRAREIPRILFRPAFRCEGNCSPQQRATVRFQTRAVADGPLFSFAHPPRPPPSSFFSSFRFTFKKVKRIPQNAEIRFTDDAWAKRLPWAKERRRRIFRRGRDAFRPRERGNVRPTRMRDVIKLIARRRVISRGF